MDNVHTFRRGLPRSPVGPTRIPHVFADSQCLQGWECGFAGTLGAVVTVTSSLKQIYDETKRHWDRNQLRSFVAELIDDEFSHDAQLRTDIKREAGIDKTDWGLRVQATHRLLTLDSTGGLDLRGLHGKAFNLYELAGYKQLEYFGPSYPTAVVYTDSPEAGGASEEEIEEYLSGGRQKIKVAAMHPKHSDRSKKYASRITPDVDIRLSWNDQPYSVKDGDLTAGNFPVHWKPGAEHAAFLRRNNCRDGTIQSECSLEAFGVLFPYEGGVQNRGVAIGIRGLDATGGCARTDDCCASIDTGPNRGTSVAYMWPNNAGARASNRFILAHEIGHWLGLCHKGHDNSSQIMLTLKETSWIKALGKAFCAQHPDFTREDGRNLWRFILQERAGKCFAVQQEPSPVE